MQLQFGVVPLAGYLFDYVTRIYTSLLADGNQAAVEFMFFVSSVMYIVFIFRVLGGWRRRPAASSSRPLEQPQAAGRSGGAGDRGTAYLTGTDPCLPP